MNKTILVIVGLMTTAFVLTGCFTNRYDAQIEQVRLQAETLQAQAEAQAMQEQARQETLRLAMQHAASGGNSDNTLAIVVIVGLMMLVGLLLWWHFRLQLAQVEHQTPHFLLPGDPGFELALRRLPQSRGGRAGLLVDLERQKMTREKVWRDFDSNDASYQEWE
jgi:outer membrane murein-binding lipoprotein Lpp